MKVIRRLLSYFFCLSLAVFSVGGIAELSSPKDSVTDEFQTLEFNSLLTAAIDYYEDESVTMDKVETGNVGVSQYTIHDVGYAKVDMLSGKLKDINEDVQIICEDKLFDNYVYMDDICTIALI